MCNGLIFTTRQTHTAAVCLVVKINQYTFGTPLIPFEFGREKVRGCVGVVNFVNWLITSGHGEAMPNPTQSEGSAVPLGDCF